MGLLSELQEETARAEVEIAKAQAEEQKRLRQEAREQEHRNEEFAMQRIEELKQELREYAAQGHHKMTLYSQYGDDRPRRPRPKSVNEFIYDWALKEFGFKNVKQGSYEQDGDDGWPRTTVQYAEVVW